MTCVTFRNGIMASDGRVTDDSDIFSNKCQKIFRLKDSSLLGLAGDAATQEIVDLFNKRDFPTVKKLKALEIDFTGIFVKPDGSIQLVEVSRPKEEDKSSQWTAIVFEIKEPFIAIGSGSKYALGAMERGATAEQAVKVSIKFDSSCGGPTQVYQLVEE